MANESGQVNQSVAPCSGKEKKKEEKSKTRNIQIKCKHRACPSSSLLKVFQVVPDVKTWNVDETITVDWTGNDPQPPPQIHCLSGKAVSGPPYIIPVSFFRDASIVHKIFPETYKSLTDQGTGKLEFSKKLLQQIFTFKYEGTMTIQDLPWGSFDVRVYNPDQWKMEIELPVSGKSSYKKGTKWDKDLVKDAKGAQSFKKTETKETSQGGVDSKSETVSQDKKVGQYEVKSKTVTTTEKDDSGTSVLTERSSTASNAQTGKSVSGSSIDISIDSPDKKQVIKLEKNGTLLDINGLKVIFFIAKALKYIKALQEIAKDIPKVGAYIECEATVLDGKFALEWGWKEYTDHRAYMRVKAEVKITFFDIKTEIGVGISGFSVKFQAFVSIQGTFDFTGTIERNAPFNEETLAKQHTSSLQRGKELYFESATSAKVELVASLVGTVGARFEALYFVKIEPKVESGLKGEGVIEFFTRNNLAEIQTTVKFTGIKAKVETSFGPSDALGNEKTSEKKGIVDGLKDKAGVDPQMKSKHGTEQPKEKVLMEEYTFWRSRFPDDLDHYSPGESILDDDLKSAINEMINGRYKNSGWFSSSKIVVKTVKSDYSQYSLWEKTKFTVADKFAYEDLPDEEVVEMIFKKLDKNRYLDRTTESIELLLLEIRNKLSGLKNKDGFVEKNDFLHFTSADLPSILNRYDDDAKKLIAKSK